MSEAHSAATARPWQVDYLDNNSQRVISGPHFEICTCWHHCVGSIEKEMEANAALIVEAVNSYDQLKAERDRLAELLSQIRKVRDGYISQAKFADIDCAVHFREFARRIDAALGKGGT